jgi:nicotinamide mononucleotide transporter
LDAYTTIEAISVLLNLIFLGLLIIQNKWCWPFGIVGSALGVFLFVWPDAQVKLYSEAILYSYYVWIGIFGWWNWTSKQSEKNIVSWSIRKNVSALIIGLGVFPVLGFVMDEFFDSNSPYLDALTTTFSFIASFLQAKRVLSSWHFWIVINGVSIYLYYSRGLELYTGLMVIYFAFSMYGLKIWKRDLKVASTP